MKMLYGENKNEKKALKTQYVKKHSNHTLATIYRDRQNEDAD